MCTFPCRSAACPGDRRGACAVVLHTRRVPAGVHSPATCRSFLLSPEQPQRPLPPAGGAAGSAAEGDRADRGPGDRVQQPGGVLGPAGWPRRRWRPQRSTLTPAHNPHHRRRKHGLRSALTVGEDHAHVWPRPASTSMLSGPAAVAATRRCRPATRRRTGHAPEPLADTRPAVHWTAGGERDGGGTVMGIAAARWHKVGNARRSSAGWFHGQGAAPVVRCQARRSPQALLLPV